MCGIAGFVGLGDLRATDEHASQVWRMVEAQRHRGPDDHGVNTIDRVVLGSNRLSIIDLSSAGHMPMCNADGSWWIVFNGEVFNFQAIRAELEGLGRRFHSKTDTEVVLQSFEQWGASALDRFVGMFGFAIYDRANDTVILARDRFGKKPVYYAEKNGQLFFASEMKALIKVLGSVRPNAQRMIEWSLYRNVDFGSPETLIDGIQSLPPGHYMMVRRGRLEKPVCYYSADSQVTPSAYERLSRQSTQKTTEEIESLIVEGVKARLISDVPVGTLCSGGIDSSLITALSAREIRDITAFNISVAGYEAIDESRYAKIVTDALGIRLLTMPLVANDFQMNLARAIYHEDAPLTHPNSVAFLLISEFARQNGVVILLSGEAADELFGGYMQRYRRYRQMLRLHRMMSWLPARVRKAVTLGGYAADGVPVTGFSEYDGLLQHATGFLDKFAREELMLRSLKAYSFVPNPNDRPILAAMLADISNFLTPLLRRLDRMSMAASVEARVPFLDHRLVSTVLNLPLSYRLRGKEDKWVLKEIASHYVPKSVVYRKKVGFPLPLADYIGPLAKPELFKGGFCVECLGLGQTALLTHVESWRTNVHGFFNLLALELWGRMFFEGQTPAQLTERWVNDARSPESSKVAVVQPQKEVFPRTTPEQLR